MGSSVELIEAVQAGNTEKTRKLLSENPDLGASRDASGVSALMHAVYRRQAGCMALLRQTGMALDIFEATAVGDMQALRNLVEGDPSAVQAYSGDGFTALHLAGYFLQPSAAKFLLERGADSAAVAKNATRVMPLHSAVSSGNMESVAELLRGGAPVNARQQHGWTALHAAAQNGSLEIVELLLQHRADPGMKNDEGVTALDLARKHERAAIAERLASAEKQSSSTTQPAAS